MKISLQKIKKWWKAIVPVVALILVLLGYGGASTPENDYNSTGSQTVATMEETTEETDTRAKGESQTETGESETYGESESDSETDESAQPDENNSGETAEESEESTEESTEESVEESAVIDKDGVYTTAEDVALYIYTYGELPGNFMTKKQAQKLGWSGGGLEDYAPGMCIGGDYFGNYEGLLPEADGREYTECDIDTLGAKSRGAKRIVFSNDGLIYYTEDHYESFVLMYGEE